MHYDEKSLCELFNKEIITMHICDIQVFLQIMYPTLVIIHHMNLAEAIVNLLLSENNCILY